MQQTYSLKINNEIKNSLLEYLFNDRWERLVDNNVYIEGKYRKDNTVITIYTSSKVVIQGFGDEYNKVIKNLEIEDSIDEYIAHIGADEVGKGDYFGPLVVCSCYISLNDIEYIKGLGIQDSKKLTDKKIEKIYEEIKDHVKYSVTMYEPTEYNDRYEQVSNIAIMLSQLHHTNTVKLIDTLKGFGLEYNKVVLDQFSSRKDRLESVFKGYNIDQFHKAESKDIVVATASIIARYYFIKYMSDMNTKYDFIFPLGSSDVINSGKEFVKKYGVDKLRDVAKISFKTTSAIVSLC